MANIKSSKKRILVASIRTERNKAIKSKVKTYLKKLDAAVLAGDKAAADVALLAAISELDKATKKGVFHKSMTSRKISRLTRRVNAMA